MRKDYEKLFTHFTPSEPPKGLFDRIIAAIGREQELQQTRRLLFGFLSLLIISFVMAPFSWKLLLEQAENSGIFYFISAAFGNFGIFLALWQDFGSAILESLPVAAMAVFTINIVLILFTVRLFLHRKKLLLSYLTNNY
jgi:hypothetical protein